MANITIVDKNNNKIIADGIIYFQTIEEGKRYLFYTLNETVEPDMLKMYVANTVDDVKIINQIDPEDWEELKKLMLKMTHNEDTSDKIKFLKMENEEYLIGIALPKKIAIKYEKKQAFIDYYSQVLQSYVDMSKTPVMNGSESFFNKEMLEEENKVEVPKEEVSIFDHPMTPTDDKTIDENEITKMLETTKQIIDSGSDIMMMISEKDYETINNELLGITASVERVKEILSGLQVVNENEQPAITQPDIQVGDANTNVLGEESVLVSNNASYTNVSAEPQTLFTGGTGFETTPINTGVSNETIAQPAAVNEPDTVSPETLSMIMAQPEPTPVENNYVASTPVPSEPAMVDNSSYNAVSSAPQATPAAVAEIAPQTDNTSNITGPAVTMPSNTVPVTPMANGQVFGPATLSTEPQVEQAQVVQQPFTM